MIRPGFWKTAAAIALGVYLGLWFCGGDREAEASWRQMTGIDTGCGWPCSVLVTAKVGGGEPDPTSKAATGLHLRGTHHCVSFHAASVAPSITRIRPDPTLTPGLTRALTQRQICGTKWGKDRRAVTLTMRHHVFAAYGIPYEQHAHYEVDHLIPRELGGADDERNLWPQPWDGINGAHAKDRLENRLHRAVCAGELTLDSAQTIIRSDWLAAARLWVR